MKPKLKLSMTPQFVIPPPFRVWCHACQMGFMSIDEAQKHDRENLAKHQGVK